MTNEEKARELAEDYRTVLAENTDFDVNDLDLAEEDATRLTLEMAEWKDQQFAEEFELIKDWFNHIAQIADDKKTLNGFAMKDSDAFDEIKCLAKRCADYIGNELYKK